jgi:4-amino-4-deoxy-L-arabinose transferase-like glycosyltransferase
VAGSALSLVLAWLVAWIVFTSGLPLGGYWALPVLALAGLLLGRRPLMAILADPDGLDLLAGQLLITGWCLGWLALVREHSGGAWTGDWYEHFERTFFFLRRWPREVHLFIDTYELPARPPLANVLTAAFLWMTRIDYAHYQVVMTVLCSLAFLPVGLLAQRFGGPGTARLAAVFLMLNPLFVQNATFPWTKLVAAFLVLAGFAFFLRARERGGSAPLMALCALCLGGAVVAHYSAGPYVVVLALAWLCAGPGRRWDRGYLRASALAALAGAAVLLPWFAWSVANYGWHSTFLSNSSVTSLGRVQGSHAAKILLNLRDTLVPPQVRGFQGGLFAQSSPWGWLRDQAFLCYQVNLPLAFGCVGWAALIRELVRASRGAGRPERRFWLPTVAGFVILSIAVYGDREHYGIVHICLQSVVLLGLAFLASRWGRLGTAWRTALIAGWLVDFALGIGLQFSIESLAIDRWLRPALGPDEAAATYGIVSQANYAQKAYAHLEFLGDRLPVGQGFVVLLLASLFALALARASRRGARAPSL